MASVRKTKPDSKILFRTAIAFLITFLLCTFVGFVMVQNRMDAEREQMERLILEHSYSLNEVISRQLYRTQALAALVIKGDGTVENFQEIAPVIAADVPALAAFLLAPGGIVVDAYPPEDNPTVVGLNFFDEDDHDGNREAILARDTGELVMGGPFLLRRGIMGLTGRYPVYINTEAGENHFWGLVAVSLKFPEALDGAGLSMLEYHGLFYELWRINPDTDERQVIASNSDSGPGGAYVERAVNIHNAEWYFRIFPLRPWYAHLETWFLLLGALAISLFIAFVMQTKNEQVRQKELELAEGKVSIMLSQIQPHFLYNVLSTIAQLCDEAPAKAKKATLDFSTYLRNNMESLNDNSLISVEKELEHVKGYLHLEKAIFGDEPNGNRLSVIFHIEAGGFFLPPLTIQPIAENAVKHGVGRKEGGGAITISVSENENEFLVAVSDDGVGYDVDGQPAMKSGQSGSVSRNHVGINNVRSRLAVMCGGTLEISSKIGKGTTAVIKIPKAT